MDDLNKAFKEKRPAMFNRKHVILHHDNARAHADLTTSRKIAELGWEILSHPPYSPNLALSDYHLYIILEVLLNAAKELSSHSDEQTVKKVEIYENYDANSWQAVVDQRIRAKTRWFTDKKEVPSKHVNRFANVATLFFYPLLRSSTEEHLELKGRDAPFLGRVLFTAGEILQCASTSPSIVKMSIFFSDFVTVLRFHDEPVIRSAVLFCYLSIATAVSDTLFPELFGNAVTGWIDWALSLISGADSSQHDRTMAGHVVTVLLEKMKVDNDSLG
uniref:Histone-lysine N-methyltransferase SETMAR n=1 Tax=Heterorhabditis bacteriophora TaxID=37862 RepID=A0A1I7X2Z7_HETBA